MCVKVLEVLICLLTFDDTGSLCYPLHKVIYLSSFSTLVTAFRFLARNREAELKPTTFFQSSFSLISCLSSSPEPPSDIVPLSAASKRKRKKINSTCNGLSIYIYKLPSNTILIIKCLTWKVVPVKLRFKIKMSTMYIFEPCLIQPN